MDDAAGATTSASSHAQTAEHEVGGEADEREEDQREQPRHRRDRAAPLEHDEPRDDDHVEEHQDVEQPARVRHRGRECTLDLLAPGPGLRLSLPPCLLPMKS
jgi:hypothetical protein